MTARTPRRPGTVAGYTADNIAAVQSTYLLSFLIVFVVLTFALAFFGVSTGNAGLFPLAGLTTFAFCAVFAYILVDGIGQDLGGSPLPMGAPLVR